MPQRKSQRKSTPQNRSTPSGRGASQTAGKSYTYEQLYKEAQKKGIKGRSKMNKAQLEKELGHSQR